MIALFLLSACLEVEGVDLVVDLREGQATATYQNFRGAGQEDLDSLLTNIEDGSYLAIFPHASPIEQTLLEDGDTLDLLVRVGFTSTTDLGLGAWDTRRPHRYCPPPDMLITESNARYRDAEGCVIWGRGAKVLRVNMRFVRQSTEDQLLPTWQQAQAAGGAAPDTSPEPEAPPSP